MSAATVELGAFIDALPRDKPLIAIVRARERTFILLKKPGLLDQEVTCKRSSLHGRRLPVSVDDLAQQSFVYAHTAGQMILVKSPFKDFQFKIWIHTPAHSHA
jgi:hypothetical protein